MTYGLLFAAGFLLITLLVLGMCRAADREDRFIQAQFDRMADPENRREAA